MMADGVALIGGFNYGDNDITGQDPVHNVTVVSGDIDRGNGGQDITDANGVVITTTNIISNNAYHVVSAIGVNGTAVLDGFTITAGQANGTIPDYWGGRFLCDGSEGKNCNPALMNNVFAGNFADNVGGALFNNGKNGIRNPTLTNVTFCSNSVKCCGRAMYKLGQGGGSSSILTNVVFSGNSAFRNGGGMYNYSYNGGTSKPILSNVTFTGNSAGGFGGAMVNDGENTGTSIPELRNSIVWNNLDRNHQRQHFLN